MKVVNLKFSFADSHSIQVEDISKRANIDSSIILLEFSLHFIQSLFKDRLSQVSSMNWRHKKIIDESMPAFQLAFLPQHSGKIHTITSNGESFHHSRVFQVNLFVSFVRHSDQAVFTSQEMFCFH